MHHRRVSGIAIVLALLTPLVSAFVLQPAASQLCSKGRQHRYGFGVRERLPILGVSSIEDSEKMSTDVLPDPPRPQPIVLPNGPTYKTWVKRLNTKEDKLGLHKISGLAFVLCSTSVLAAGVDSEFKEIPMWLQYADAGILLSSSVQFFTSVDMAIHHRRRQPGARDQMISMACASIFLATMAPTFAPFAPVALCDKPTFDFAAISLMAINLFFNIRGIAFATRGQDSSSAWQVFLLGMSAVVPFIGYIAFFIFLMDPSHDHESMMSFANDRGGPAYFYYTNVFTNSCVMYSALLVTLKDKKLVPQHIERFVSVCLLSFPCVPVFALMF